MHTSMVPSSSSIDASGEDLPEGSLDNRTHFSFSVTGQTYHAESIDNLLTSSVALLLSAPQFHPAESDEQQLESIMLRWYS